MTREEKVWEIQRRRNRITDLKKLIREEEMRMRARWDGKWLPDHSRCACWFNRTWMLNFCVNWRACRIQIYTPLFGVDLNYDAPMWPKKRLSTGIRLGLIAKRPRELREGEDVYRYNTWLGYDRGITRGEMEGL